MDPISVTAAAAKGVEIIKSLVEIKSAADAADKHAEIKAFIHELLDSLNNAQARIHLLQEGLSKAKEENSRLQEKIGKRDQYTLVQLGDEYGAHVYESAEMQNGQRHYACPNCFNKDLISILRSARPDKNGIGYMCVEKGCAFDCIDRSITAETPREVISPKSDFISRTRGLK